MKHVSCTTVVALCVIGLFTALPAAAGCGETCWPSGECDNPASWETGCYMSGTACLDLPNCWFAAAHRDQILAAAKAGDYAKVADLAKEVGGLLRVTVKTEKGVVAVYDGWALAGLAAPGTPGYEAKVASAGQRACDVAVTAPEAEAAAEPAAAVAPQE